MERPKGQGRIEKRFSSVLNADIGRNQKLTKMRFIEVIDEAGNHSIVRCSDVLKIDFRTVINSDKTPKYYEIVIVISHGYTDVNMPANDYPRNDAEKCYNKIKAFWKSSASDISPRTLKIKLEKKEEIVETRVVNNVQYDEILN